jgi:uncharacterized membrane protein YfcA
VITAILLGVLAGIVSGLLGVGGGILFVPALVIVLGQGQLEAEATSLLAVIPVAIVGATRQHRYGNVRLRDAGVLAVFSPIGVVVGVAFANSLPERALAIGFSILVLFVAFQLAQRALRKPAAPTPATEAGT